MLHRTEKKKCTMLKSCTHWFWWKISTKSVQCSSMRSHEKQFKHLEFRQFTVTKRFLHVKKTVISCGSLQYSVISYKIHAMRYNWFPLAVAHFVIHIHDFCSLFNSKCLFDIKSAKKNETTECHSLKILDWWRRMWWNDE